MTGQMSILVSLHVSLLMSWGAACQPCATHIRTPQVVQQRLLVDSPKIASELDPAKIILAAEQNPHFASELFTPDSSDELIFATRKYNRLRGDNRQAVDVPPDFRVRPVYLPKLTSLTAEIMIEPP